MASTAIFWYPMRRLRTRRLRYGNEYVLAHVPNEGMTLEDLEAARTVQFPMRPATEEEGDLGTVGLFMLKYRVEYFHNPFVRLYRSFLVVDYGPAKRAVVPYRNIARITDGKLRSFRHLKDAVRFTRGPDAVLFELDPATEILKDKRKVVSASFLLLGVVDPAGFVRAVESVARTPDAMVD